MRDFLTFCLLAGLAVVQTAGPASAQSVLEQRFATLEPCASVQITQNVFGVPVTVGLTELDGLTVNAAALQIVGDNAVFALAGSLSCRAGSAALLQGEAGVEIDARAEIAMADCNVGRVDLVVSEFTGSLADLLQSAWDPFLQPLLVEEARGWLHRICVEMTALPVSP